MQGQEDLEYTPWQIRPDAATHVMMDEG